MPELPTTFGKYFLTEKLATGGMAEIYLAKIVGPGGFEKQLVIKQIHPKLSGQRHFVDLFVAEAKTLVTLTHGNIVPVYELGVVDDTYFIAMEYIDGPTLYRFTEMLARRDAVMAPDVAAWITARIVEGLDYAHRKGVGVIHRDLSPRNVMLSREGEVKLVDFGIAVTLGNSGEDETQSAPTGSFPYMSPEQVRKEQLTGQTDVFSVGVLAWEMLVGHRLFARNDPDATLFAVTEEEIPRPASARPEIPAKLDEIVMRALERDKTARWSNAGEMLAALQRYLYGLEEMPGPRDVAALVAKFCPPETRRMPTHADGPFEPDEPDAPAIAGETQLTPPPTPPGGPRTAVIPRDGASARGKVPRQQKSFATHVELKDMLERATPMFGVPAIDDSEPATNIEAPPEPSPPVDPPPTTKPPATTQPPATTKAPSPPDDGPDSTMRIRTSPPDRDRGAAPGHTGLVMLALGGLALAVVSVIVFWQMRDHGGLQPDAAPKLDQPFYMLPDAGGDAAGDATGDADPGGVTAADATMAATADAAMPPVSDAPTTPVRDAALEHPVDAGTKPVDAPGALVPDAKVVPAGTGTVEIGAEPWGDIVVDGKPRGRTPATLTLPAGKHTIEVIFGGEDPPRSKRFDLDLAAGAIEKPFADFSKP
ncbi:MAG: serine/threonine protein kinase [Myxococcales bacterium]|nr:serine/threonine protein kinase [Myxococcales bacterium]